MSDRDELFTLFCEALNAEIAALGGSLRVRGGRSDDMVMLLDAAGRELGALPDHVDAVTIAAFEPIIAQHRVTAGRASSPTASAI